MPIPGLGPTTLVTVDGRRLVPHIHVSGDDEAGKRQRVQILASLQILKFVRLTISSQIAPVYQQVGRLGRHLGLDRSPALVDRRAKPIRTSGPHVAVIHMQKRPRRSIPGSHPA